MNLEDLTLGQIKQIQKLFSKENDLSLSHHAIGKKVIIRTYSAGVHYGTLVKKEGDECQLNNAIRIWQWSGAFTLSQLAMEGSSSPGNCKFAMPIDNITLKWIEIIPCTEKAIESIEGIEPCKK